MLLCLYQDCEEHRIEKRRYCRHHREMNRQSLACTIGDCSRKSMALAMCALHYQRHSKGADLHAPIRYDGYHNDGPCSIEWCHRPAVAFGLCNMHRRRQVKGHDMNELARSHRPPNTVCAADGCQKLHSRRGYCAKHYRRLQRHGRLTLAVNQWPIGSRRVANKQGYIEIKHQTGRAAANWQLEHRYIIEQYLRRSLLMGETVHHVNGDRADNRIDNLELWSASHPSGQRVSDKLIWARNFIRAYGYDVIANPDDRQPLLMPTDNEV